MNEAEITGGGFIISCGEASRAFEAVDAALDSISDGVDEVVDDDRLLAVLAAWDDSFGAARSCVISNGVGIITAVGDHDLRIGAVGGHDEVVAFVIRDFPAGDFRRDGEAFAVGAEVDFGGEAAFRAAKTLFLSPPFAPAA